MKIKPPYFWFLLLIPVEIFAFGVDIDTIQKDDSNNVSEIMREYEEELSQIENDKKSLREEVELDVETKSFGALLSVMQKSNELAAQAEVIKDKMANLDAKKASPALSVEPEVQAGDNDIGTSLNFSYNTKLGWGVGIVGKIRLSSQSLGRSGDEAANAFAVDGGNINVGISVDRRNSVGSGSTIDLIYGFHTQYSSVSTDEINTESGGIFDVRNELLSSGVNFAIGFDEKFYIALQHSYHDLTGNELENDFSRTVNHERSTVLSVILPVGEDDKGVTNKFISIERASPISDSDAQIRLSFTAKVALF